ncbi:MAG: helix-turn-helix domain-containing protein [Comamonas sp.]
MTHFTILVPEGALAGSVGASLDILGFAKRCGAPPHRCDWQVVSMASSVAMSGGMSMAATPLRDVQLAPSTVLVIPGIGLDMEPPDGGTPGIDSINDRYAEARLLARMQSLDAVAYAQLAAAHHAVGGRVAASCSGVLLLGMAGLLDGRHATTHWRLGDFVRRHFPKAQLDENRMLVKDGLVTSAGAAMAQVDLMLHLVQAAVGGTQGEAVVKQIMQYLLVDSRSTQARYRVWEHMRGAGDDTAMRFEALMESRLPHIPTIAEAAEQLGMTARTLSRRIAASTGLAPLQLVNTVRMRHAQRLLARGELSLNEVAQRVGYANATALRKLTMKMAQLPPGVLRHSVDI